MGLSEGLKFTERRIVPSLGTILALLLIAALSVGLIEARQRVESERRRMEAAQLFAANASARRDSTRDVTTTRRTIARIAGDTLRVLERLVVQERQHGDALDTALGVQRVAAYRLAAALDSARMILRTLTKDSSSIRFASFSVRHEPFTVDAGVTIPPPPDSATLTFRIRTDTIPISVRVGCDAGMPVGYSARVDVVTPRWMTTHIGTVSQDPAVCAAARAVPPQRPARARRFVPVAGIGRIVSSGASPRWGAFVGIAWSPLG